MGGFNFAQFKTMLHVIRDGEEQDEGALDSISGSDRQMSKQAKWGLMGFVLIALCAGLFMLGKTCSGLGFELSTVFMIMLVMLLVMVVVVGFYQAVSSLYFVRDMPFYLSLPVSPSAVMMAKLTLFLSSQFALNLVVLAFGVGFLFGSEAEPMSYLLMVLSFLPCSLCLTLSLVIIVVPLMRFSRFFNDKDRFARVFGIIITVVTLAITAAISLGQHSQSMASMAMGSMGEVVKEGVAPVVITVLCAPVSLISFLFNGNALLGILGMVAICCVYLAVLILLASKWYFAGVRGMQGGTGRKSYKVFSNDELAKSTKQRGQLTSLLAVDMKTTLCTPTFFQQFVIGMLEMPFSVIVIGVLSVVFLGSDSPDSGFGMLMSILQEATFDSPFFSFLLVAGFLLIAFCAVSSMFVALSLGRDGYDFFYLRTMPLNMKSYVQAKFLTSFLTGRLPFFVLLAILLIIGGAPVESALFLALFAAFIVTAIDYIMLVVGSKSPNVTWESESQLTSTSACMELLVPAVISAAACLAIPVLVFWLSTFIDFGGGMVVAPVCLVVSAIECIVARMVAMKMVPAAMEKVRP